jgi:predicted homoserine dehydrogenase-like protein
MIIVDKALQEREKQGRPIRVGLVGAGFMGRGIALQILSAMVGMRLVAISNRTVGHAERAYLEAGADSVESVDSVEQLESAIHSGRYAITDNAMLLCEAQGIDAIIEGTGEIEFGARVALAAIEHSKHVILMNAELDAVVGPILKVYADRAGVVVTNVDGDQPGVIMNLYRFVKTIGYNPVLLGNIKGLQDHYRTPETQREFAQRHHQKPRMITSFADGTKISMEMAVVANATGFKVGKRGMYGPACHHVSEAPKLFPTDQLLDGGLVDFILGAEPGPGVFVLGYNEHPIKRQYMTYLKMGEGPVYVFYVPYHLPHLETPLTVARAVLFHDATVTPLGAPIADVLAAAKRDLKAGDLLDGIGGFTCYGLIDNHDTVRREKLLLMSLSEGCRLTRNIGKDQPISFDDVELPGDRLCDRLRDEQNAHFDKLNRVA